MSPRIASTRRSFLNRISLLGLASSLLHQSTSSRRLRGIARVSRCRPGIVSRRILSGKKPRTAGSKCFLLSSYRLGSVRPSGIGRRSNSGAQAAGLSGHLDETWAECCVPTSHGCQPGGERRILGEGSLTAYGGLVPLAYLLDDARLKAKAQRFIDWTLTHPSPDGMIGPKGNDDWWPRMVMVKALAQ